MSFADQVRIWNRDRLLARRARKNEAGGPVSPEPAVAAVESQIEPVLLKPADLQITYSGLRGVSDDEHAHLGGNVVEGDPFTFAPSVWDYLINRFGIESVMDLGSGIGYASAYFHRAGLKVLAVEGLKSNCEAAIFPTILGDITQAPIICRVDLVHCQEVVEHIDEKYIDNLLKSLCCGKYVVMTNALPGQGGHHHVNEQPTEYWVEKLAAYGCEVLIEDSNRIRQLAAKDGAFYLAKTALVLANRNR